LLKVLCITALIVVETATEVLKGPDGRYREAGTRRPGAVEALLRVRRSGTGGMTWETEEPGSRNVIISIVRKITNRGQQIKTK